MIVATASSVGARVNEVHGMIPGTIVLVPPKVHELMIRSNRVDQPLSHKISLRAETQPGIVQYREQSTVELKCNDIQYEHTLTQL